MSKSGIGLIRVEELEFFSYIMEPPCSFHPCDEAVIATNDDASDCKRCAVRLGYWKDEYIGYFVRNQDRKAPEINRGYFARVKGVEMCVEKFLKPKICTKFIKVQSIVMLMTPVGLLTLKSGFEFQH
uniref:Uncharacterized protein n=1 Tax=Glossina brevipalpis TaxID=37001 RepID=A0A1A9WVZ7_9MUSC